MRITTRFEDRRRKIEPLAVLLFFLVAALTVILGYTLVSMSGERPGLAEEVMRHLPQSGMVNPVTAVLLNFRGYDTLLEVMVLFLAVVGVWSMARALPPVQEQEMSPVQQAMVRLLVPLMSLVAAYLVWQGGTLAGGAFQAGAVLAGAGVLMLVSDLPWIRSLPENILRLVLTLGPVVFYGVAVSCLFLGQGFLVYPSSWAGLFMLLIEAACAVSIGLTLALLFIGGRLHDRPSTDGTPLA